jgi:hypothetical protein
LAGSLAARTDSHRGGSISNDSSLTHPIPKADREHKRREISTSLLSEPLVLASSVWLSSSLLISSPCLCSRLPDCIFASELHGVLVRAGLSSGLLPLVPLLMVDWNGSHHHMFRLENATASCEE